MCLWVSLGEKESKHLSLDLRLVLLMPVGSWQRCCGGQKVGHNPTPKKRVLCSGAGESGSDQRASSKEAAQRLGTYVIHSAVAMHD